MVTHEPVTPTTVAGGWNDTKHDDLVGTSPRLRPFVFEWTNLDLSCVHMAAHAINSRGGIASAVRVHHLKPDVRLVVHAASREAARAYVQAAGSDVHTVVSALRDQVETPPNSGSSTET